MYPFSDNFNNEEFCYFKGISKDISKQISCNHRPVAIKLN